MALLAAFAPGGCGEGEGEDGDEVIGVVVGPEGGLVVSDDGVLSIILPAGAVTEPTLVTVELTGACVSCPASTVTLKAGVERILKDRVPGVTAVEQYGVDPVETESAVSL